LSSLVPPVAVGQVVSVEYLDQVGRFGDRVAKLGAFVVFVRPPIVENSNRVKIIDVKSRSANAISIPA